MNHWGQALDPSLGQRSCPHDSSPRFILEEYRAVTHTTRGRDCRQEGSESGYYYLHRNLNHFLFQHNYSLLITNSPITNYSLLIPKAPPGAFG